MEFLQIKMKGWTATPRMPFIISGNAICLPVPTYSLLLGLIGCCVGRVVDFEEVSIGFRYAFDQMAKDKETRNRLEVARSGKLIPHSKGKDAYDREFHTRPSLLLWLNRLDWQTYFENPVGTPALGRSQDLLQISGTQQVTARPISDGELCGTLVPFRPGDRLPGQIIQCAEAFREKDEIGTGRVSTRSRIFLAIHHDQKVQAKIGNLYQTTDGVQFYLHEWK